MAFTRVVLAWLAAGTWLVAWEMGARRLRKQAAPRAVPDVALWIPITEAAWLVLLTALWIGSLGSGSWWLVMLFVALIAVWGPVLSSALPLTPQKRAVALATRVVRLLGAGVLAGLIVG